MASLCAGVTLTAKVIETIYVNFMSGLPGGLAPVSRTLDDLVDGRDDSKCMTKCSHMNIDDSNIPR